MISVRDARAVHPLADIAVDGCRISSTSRIRACPVEATIALSIAFVATELVKMKHGEKRLSEAYPWVVAFAFGLLHGFGFAGALKEPGLPQTDGPVALLTFNLGVEAGQLSFVAALLLVYRAIRALVTIPLVPARTVAAYLIGTVSMVWLIARLSSFGSAT